MPDATLDVVFDHLHAMRRRDLDDVATRLHQEVIHQGVLPEYVCDGRDQVLDNMRRVLEQPDFGVDRLEIIDAGERVVVGLAGPRFSAREGTPLQGQVFLVFTVRAGMIVRMDDFLTRDQALSAAAAEPAGWL